MKKRKQQEIKPEVPKSKKFELWQPPKREMSEEDPVDSEDLDDPTQDWGEDRDSD